MKLLLDAMYAPEIARQLRQRGHDVVAATEYEHLADLRDADLFAVAQVEERAIVTNDAGGFLRLDRLCRRQGRQHFGVILTSDRRFPRHRSGSIGPLVLALDAFLREQPAEVRTESLVHWLQ